MGSPKAWLALLDTGAITAAKRVPPPGVVITVCIVTLQSTVAPDRLTWALSTATLIPANTPFNRSFLLVTVCSCPVPVMTPCAIVALLATKKASVNAVSVIAIKPLRGDKLFFESFMEFSPFGLCCKVDLLSLGHRASRGLRSVCSHWIRGNWQAKVFTARKKISANLALWLRPQPMCYFIEAFVAPTPQC